MSHQVLARKYRPRTFQTMVGQEHVLRALINALNQGRLHHAYLFTGTRGVGKTSIARILAKCLSCEKGVSAISCDTCTNCREINEGRYIDLLEVDAASRTKVEDTRELLDNIQYSPHRGRYKVYLIDEVHMLSGHSFNALLKTLEEPPAHVKFLLATTDPERLPATILSRCLQFHLKNLTPEKIKSQFEFVLQQENINFEPTALLPLAKAANGSLRDGLSLLDQAIAYGEGAISSSEVNSMLGTIEQTHIEKLLHALIAKQGDSILTIVAQLAEQSADFMQVLEALLTALHQIALLQVIPNAAETIENHAILADFAKQLTPEDVQLYYQIALIGRRDLPLAPSLRGGFEMIMLRMLAFQMTETHSTLIEPVKPVAASAVELTTSKTILENAPVQNISPPRQIPSNDWEKIIPQLNLTGFAQALANHCELQELSENFINLSLDPSQAALLNAKQEARLNEALNSYFGKPMRLQIKLGSTNLTTPARTQKLTQQAQLDAATQAITKDENIQAIIQTFDAKIQPGSIQVIEQDSKSIL